MEKLKIEYINLSHALLEVNFQKKLALEYLKEKKVEQEIIDTVEYYFENVEHGLDMHLTPIEIEQNN